MLEPTLIHCDNKICVRPSMNPVSHDKSKHVEIKYHYIRDMVQRRTIILQYISTDELTADIMTKPLSRAKFVYFRDKLGVAENVSLVERECLCLRQHHEKLSPEGPMWTSRGNVDFIPT
jgi:hypothetical protein